MTTRKLSAVDHKAGADNPTRLRVQLCTRGSLPTQYSTTTDRPRSSNDSCWLRAEMKPNALETSSSTIVKQPDDVSSREGEAPVSPAGAPRDEAGKRVGHGAWLISARIFVCRGRTKAAATCKLARHRRDDRSGWRCPAETSSRRSIGFA